MANLFMSYQRGRGAVLAQKRWKNGIGMAEGVTKWQMIGFARFYGYAVSRFQVSRFAVSRFLWLRRFCACGVSMPSASSGLAVGMSCSLAVGMSCSLADGMSCSLAVGMSCCSPDRSSASQVFC